MTFFLFYRVVFINARYAAQASSRGGTTEVRRAVWDWVTANLISAAVADGNSDRSRATVPVKNGVATLVPPSVSGLPSAPRLAIASPGASSPRLPIELPRFDSPVGRP